MRQFLPVRQADLDPETTFPGPATGMSECFAPKSGPMTEDDAKPKQGGEQKNFDLTGLLE
jgi:hypothetical protein